mmetsp:Transcript_12632/g.46653  ORF Transcript_12632/g.46653 Transcript_12632/m.46653 type:complete len:237 (-) Transcript_12632:409-1119(-)|eukprot:scaffold2342_cov368-Pinguiococcus_pyrenoidosus.AAC.5
MAIDRHLPERDGPEVVQHAAGLRAFGKPTAKDVQRLGVRDVVHGVVVPCLRPCPAVRIAQLPSVLFQVVEPEVVVVVVGVILPHASPAEERHDRRRPVPNCLLYCIPIPLLCQTRVFPYSEQGSSSSPAALVRERGARSPRGRDVAADALRVILHRQDPHIREALLAGELAAMHQKAAGRLQGDVRAPRFRLLANGMERLPPVERRPVEPGVIAIHLGTLVVIAAHHGHRPRRIRA